MSDPIEECECVRRLLLVCGLSWADAQPLDRRAPDVLVTWPNGWREVFEVTQIHPDEVPGEGSAARAAEEQRARLDPTSTAAVWLQTEFMPAIRYRIEEKVRKAAKYDVRPGESLSLLIVGSLPKLVGWASTHVIGFLVPVGQLDAVTSDLLSRSRFQRAYLHLPLSDNAVFEWTRTSGWQIKRQSDNYGEESRQMLEQIKARGGVDSYGRLPGTQILGRWP